MNYPSRKLALHFAPWGNRSQDLKNLVSPHASHVLLEVINLLTHTNNVAMNVLPRKLTLFQSHWDTVQKKYWLLRNEMNKRWDSLCYNNLYVKKIWLCVKSTIAKIYFIHPKIWASILKSCANNCTNFLNPSPLSTFHVLLDVDLCHTWQFEKIKVGLAHSPICWHLFTK